MQSITRKQEIRQIIASIDKSTADSWTDSIQQKLFSHKIRFPLLEFAAREIYPQLSKTERFIFLEKLPDTRMPGSYVFAGIFLQWYLDEDYEDAIRRSVSYMITGNEWYVCDIIGERVQGHALLTQPEKTMDTLKKLAVHPDKWVVRSVGVAAHYAIKKGLPEEYVKPVFELLLSLAGSKDLHTKKGIGWAAKTAVKFYPGLAEEYAGAIYRNPEVKQWFKTKIRIGLDRSEKYARRNSR
jgi:hypothetical protein